jgi:hypothetical protein
VELSVPRTLKTIFIILSLLAVIAAFISFFAFLGDSARLHGDALNGYISSGRYYVSSHGVDTEVSEAAWRHNRELGQWMQIVFPLGFLGMGYLVLGIVLPYFMFPSNPQDRDASVQEVLSTGQELVSLHGVGGQVGAVHMRGPFITATLYPGGFVVKTGWRPFAVKANEIRTVVIHRGFMKRGVEIKHRSKLASSPIFLACDPDNAFVVKLVELAERDQVRTGK